jgi:hypothetical protein
MDDTTAALRALLAAHEWHAADDETRRLLIEDADVGGFIGVDADEASHLHCDLLVAIDEAWTGASDGHFGLGTQQRILATELKDSLATNETWRSFGREVGWVRGREWIEAGDLTYSLDAPEGHLPYIPGIGTVVTTGRVYEAFLAFYNRVADCMG